MSFFLLLNTKEDILKNDWNSCLAPLTSIVEKNTMEVNGAKQLFGSNRSSNIFLCVQQKKKNHTGLQ